MQKSISTAVRIFVIRTYPFVDRSFKEQRIFASVRSNLFGFSFSFLQPIRNEKIGLKLISIPSSVFLPPCLPAWLPRADKEIKIRDNKVAWAGQGKDSLVQTCT